MSEQLEVILRQLAHAVWSGAQPLPLTEAAVRARGIPSALVTPIVKLAAAADSQTVRHALQAMAEAVRVARPAPPQLVITDVDDATDARTPLAVLQELVQRATSQLTLTSFSWGHFAPGEPVAEHPLLRAIWMRMRVCPQLQVRLLLRVPPDKTPGPAAAQRKFVHTFWTYLWPWEERPTVYLNLPTADYGPGTLHAKLIVADARWSVITSANLTTPAFLSNLEVGVLLDDTAVGQQLEQRVDAWIARGRVVRLG